MNRFVQTTEITLSHSAQQLIETLGLLPHPEGGHFLETFRDSHVLQTQNGERNLSTAIFYLLESGDYSGWHRVTSAETWHHYQGAVLHLHLLDAEGYRCVELGPDICKGQRPQFVVPAGCWQAAEVTAPGYALCGCTVSPGFDFRDFEMATPWVLAEQFPNHSSNVGRLIRPTPTK